MVILKRFLNWLISLFESSPPREEDPPPIELTYTPSVPPWRDKSDDWRRERRRFRNRHG